MKKNTPEIYSGFVRNRDRTFVEKYSNSFK